MMQVLIAPAVLATVIGLWLVWLKRRERAEDHALTVRAEIQSAVNRALEGESLLAVQVEPASSFHRGRGLVHRDYTVCKMSDVAMPGVRIWRQSASRGTTPSAAPRR